jgi:glycerol-3-phosphate dehydrogenase
MINSAPYMAHPLPIMVPCYRWWEVPYFWAGMKLYDLVAGRHSGMPPSHYISRDEAIYSFPMLKCACCRAQRR